MRVRMRMGILGSLCVFAAIFFLCAPDAWLAWSATPFDPALRMTAGAFFLAVAAIQRDVEVAE